MSLHQPSLVVERPYQTLWHRDFPALTVLKQLKSRIFGAEYRIRTDALTLEESRATVKHQSRFVFRAFFAHGNSRKQHHILKFHLTNSANFQDGLDSRYLQPFHPLHGRTA